MKKVLLVTASLIALGATAPAVAADLAARPYTKAPPMIAAVYDWSGFYIGANGGWGSSRNCWDFLPVAGGVANEGCHDASGGTVGGQIGYRWQAGTWVFGVEAQGNWADFKGSNVSLFAPAFRNEIEGRRVRPVHRSGRLRRQQRPVLRQGRCGCDFERVPFVFAATPTARSLASPATTPVGAARSASASNTASLRTGRSASNTITCSCRTVPTPSPRRVASSSAPIASVRTSISSPLA